MSRAGKTLLSFLTLMFAFPILSAGQSASESRWVGTWAASPMLADGGFRVHVFAGTTLREIAPLSLGGKQIRIRFTNDFGADPLTIEDAHVGLSDGNSAIRPTSDRHYIRRRKHGKDSAWRCDGLRSGSTGCGAPLRRCSQFLSPAADHARRNLSRLCRPRQLCGKRRRRRI